MELGAAHVAMLAARLASAADTIKVGALHSLSGIMVISDVHALYFGHHDDRRSESAGECVVLFPGETRQGWRSKSSVSTFSSVGESRFAVTPRRAARPRAAARDTAPADTAAYGRDSRLELVTNGGAWPSTPIILVSRMMAECSAFMAEVVEFGKVRGRRVASPRKPYRGDQHANGACEL